MGNYPAYGKWCKCACGAAFFIRPDEGDGVCERCGMGHHIEQTPNGPVHVEGFENPITADEVDRLEELIFNDHILPMDFG